jgi:hypothetical protein
MQVSDDRFQAESGWNYISILTLLIFILLQNSTCFGQLLCPSSGVFYCTFGTGKFHDRFQAESRWNCSSILTLLGSGHQNLHETYQCRMYGRKLLMMGRKNARNM